MKKRIEILLLAVLCLFFSCTKEQTEYPVDNAHTAVLNAEISGQQKVSTRAATDNETNTYTSFAEGDCLGLFATPSLRTNTPEFTAVDNLKFEMTGGKWGGVTPLLKWDTSQGLSADIYAYYPHQENISGGLEVFRSVSGESGVLKDILNAERTTVENNNPAIFLTFRHRFALIHVQLGTGMGAVTESDLIAAVMDQGVASTALLEKSDGVVKLQAGDIKEFLPVKKDKSYYILVPVDKLSGETDSIKLTGIRIGDVVSPLDKTVIPSPNKVYSLTVHKGSEGNMYVKVGYIEEWEDWNDLAGIRQEGGLYWASDFVNLVNQYNRDPSRSNTALERYGEWNEEKDCWEFRLMRNLDMMDAPNGRGSMFNEFEGIFDGGGYSIKGLDIESAGKAGMFGSVKGGSVIKDLTLINASVKGGAAAGVLAGSVEDGVEITNCHVEGHSAVTGNGSVGGLIGSCEADLNRCSANITVNNGSADFAGGLVGRLGIGGTITDSHVSGSIVSEGAYAGGLAGRADGPVKDCHAACDVKGTDHVGGLIGQAAADVSGCYSAGKIEGKNNIGGLIGQSSAHVVRCGSDGSVKGDNNVGGLVGSSIAPEGFVVSINGCSSRSAVTGLSGVGGLVGKGTEYIPESGDETIVPASGTTVAYSYATNRLPLSGSGDSLIEYCYEVGTSGGDPAKHYYAVALNAAPAEIDGILAGLNSGGSQPWTLGTVIIDGKGCTLPVLTKYK